MIRNKCLVCGSSSLRADRSLSGRLVCNSCGTPFGIGRRVNNKTSIYNIVSLKNKNFIFICILIFAFIIVVI
tara:strand:- start:1300 stop:1515 length:216 start_codon:yes stop_codon:yes gene_type:complete